MTRKGRDAKAAWTGAETEASRRDKELPAAAKPGPPSQCDSMVGYDGYCYTHKRAGEDCQTIRALEARVKEYDRDYGKLVTLHNEWKARAEKAEAELVELKAWAAWATKRLKADIKRRAALRVKP